MVVLASNLVAEIQDLPGRAPEDALCLRRPTLVAWIEPSAPCSRYFPFVRFRNDKLQLDSMFFNPSTDVAEQHVGPGTCIRFGGLVTAPSYAAAISASASRLLQMPEAKKSILR